MSEENSIVEQVISEIRDMEGHPGYTIDRAGVVRLDGIIQPSRIDSTGYYTMSLKNSKGIWRPNRIKDLVAKAFLPNDDPTRKKYLGVKNHDRKNHHVDNLIWRTPKEHGAYSASIPIDKSETRECNTCKQTLPMTNFPYDHPDHESGELRHRRHICQKCISALRPPPTPAQKAKKRDRDLRAQYRITLEQYDAMFKAQDGRCATCNVDISGKQCAHVDHCHTTERVRGILCPNCNRALGMVGDNPAILQALIEYLQKHSAIPRIPKMPVSSPRTKPPKKGKDHGNSGLVRSPDTKAQISATKKRANAEKREAAFQEQIDLWKSEPTGKKQTAWRQRISREYHGEELSQIHIDMLNNTPGWTFCKKGTPHKIDSRIQPTPLTPAPATPPGTP
jgi:hypothetical protein